VGYGGWRRTEDTTGDYRRGEREIEGFTMKQRGI